MTDQKTKWANRAATYEARADKLQAEAERLNERKSWETDIAFLTQPGRIPQRDAMHRRLERAADLAKQAKALSDKARNLRSMSQRTAGDAEKAREAIRTACDVAVGDMVSSLYGVRRVIKVNRNTVLTEGSFGPIKICKTLIRKVAA